MKYLERRMDQLISKADKMVDDCGGDIYGANLKVFQRWNNLMRIVGELAVIRQQLLKEQK